MHLPNWSYRTRTRLAFIPGRKLLCIKLGRNISPSIVESLKAQLNESLKAQLNESHENV